MGNLIRERNDPFITLLQRKREADAASGKGAVSAEEAAALARREAAKNRVAQRTAQGFGFL